MSHKSKARKVESKKREISKDACCQPTGTVLDKIQAELAETRRREDELKRSRLNAIIVIIAMHSGTISNTHCRYSKATSENNQPTRGRIFLK